MKTLIGGLKMPCSFIGLFLLYLCFPAMAFAYAFDVIDLANNVRYPIDYKQGDLLGIPAAISPDRRLRALVSKDHGLLIWEGISERRMLSTFDSQSLPVQKLFFHIREKNISAISFYPDNSHIVVATGKDVFTWSFRTGRKEAVFSSNTSSITAVSVSPDSKTLALGTDFRDVHLKPMLPGGHEGILTIPPQPGIDLETDRYHAHTTAINFSADSQRLVSGTRAGQFRIWDLRTLSMTHLYGQNTDPLRAVSFVGKDNLGIFDVTHWGVLHVIDARDPLVRIVLSREDTPYLDRENRRAIFPTEMLVWFYSYVANWQSPAGAGD